jgi:hypothetical protein
VPIAANRTLSTRIQAIFAAQTVSRTGIELICVYENTQYGSNLGLLLKEIAIHKSEPVNSELRCTYSFKSCYIPHVFVHDTESDRPLGDTNSSPFSYRRFLVHQDNTGIQYVFWRMKPENLVHYYAPVSTITQLVSLFTYNTVYYTDHLRTLRGNLSIYTELFTCSSPCGVHH